MNTNRQRIPVLFVGHGNPMNAIESNRFHRGWQELGRSLPTPRAVLCISAHWETAGRYLSSSERPETIHDFYGFPKALYEMRYPAPGDPSLARRTAALLSTHNVRLDPARGLDHGAWSVLVAMYPAADIPVVQLSMDTGQPGSFHYHLARALAPLRDEGVLIMGSGNMVHHLGLFNFHDPTPYSWAVTFDEELKKRIVSRQHDELISPETLGSKARLAIPTPEHYLPLLYVLALHEEGEPVSFINSEVVSSVSMTSVLIGSVG